MAKQISKSSLTVVMDTERGSFDVSLSLSISSSGALTDQQDFAVAVWRLNMCLVPRSTSYLQTHRLFQTGVTVCIPSVQFPKN